MRIPLILAAVSACLSSPAAASPDPATVWSRTFQSPQDPFGYSFRTWVAFQGGLFIAQVQRGFTEVSTDGTNWTSIPLPAALGMVDQLQFDPTRNMFGANMGDGTTGTFRLGKLVAWSPGDAAWHTISTPINIDSFTTGNGTWVIAAADDTTYASGDLAEWTQGGPSQPVSTGTYPSGADPGPPPMGPPGSLYDPHPFGNPEWLSFDGAWFHMGQRRSADGLHWEVPDTVLDQSPVLEPGSYVEWMSARNLPLRRVRFRDKTLGDSYSGIPVEFQDRTVALATNGDSVLRIDASGPIHPGWALNVQRSYVMVFDEMDVARAEGFDTSGVDSQVTAAWGGGRFLLFSSGSYASEALLTLNREGYRPHQRPTYIAAPWAPTNGDMLRVDCMVYGNGVFVCSCLDSTLWTSDRVEEEDPYWGDVWLFQDGWKQLPDRGWIWDGFEQWAWQPNVGWVCHDADPADGLWCDIEPLGWVRTLPEYFPWVYVGPPINWYRVDLSTFAPNLRLWYFTDVGGWQSVDQSDL